MSAAVTIHPVTGLPEIRPGDDLGALLAQALRALGLALQAGDVLVIAQKVVSKAEGSRVALASVEPSAFARQWAERWSKDARLTEVVLRESRRLVRMERGVIIAETHHGYICANAGVDLSNAGAPGAGAAAHQGGTALPGEMAILLPEDPDRSAQGLRDALRADSGVDVGVIVADTFGRPWRVGLTQVALGVAGLAPLVDYRESPDVDGRTLHATIIAVADELACAADLVCGKTRRVPAAVIRGYASQHEPGATGAAGPDSNGAALLRAPEMDLFR